VGRSVGAASGFVASSSEKPKNASMHQSTNDKKESLNHSNSTIR
jgi:hypothetical protein